MFEMWKAAAVQDFRTETFLDVCQTLNYTQTAHRLNITQPAVSQHIAYLESVYGAKLFEYRSRRLSLTEAGAILRDALEVMVHDERLIGEHIASLQGGRRTISIGVTLTAGEYIIARPLAGFLAKRQDLQARVVSADTEGLLEMLHEGTVDCAFVEGFFDKSAYDWEVFSSERLVAVCAPDHRFEREPEAFEDLLGEHLIVREQGSGTRAVLEHALAAHNLSLGAFVRTTEVSSINIIKAFVENDYGIAFLYEAAVEAECARGILQAFALGEQRIMHDIAFIWLKGSVFASEFCNFAIDIARETTG